MPKNKKSSKKKINTKHLEKIAEGFNLVDVLTILTDYQLLHSEFPQSPFSGNFVYGQQDPTQRKIYIDNTSSLPVRRFALIHELLHAYSDLHGLGLSEEEVGELSVIVNEKFIKRK